MEQGITFVNIPIEIFSSKDLTPIEKHLYGWLSIFKKQCCYQSNESIASSLGISERGVSRGLKKLEEMQYIFIEYTNGNHAKRRIYTLFDNPKKIAYLTRKGMFSTSRAKTEKRYAKLANGVRQNGVRVRQIGEPQNRDEVRQIGDHIIIKDNIKERKPNNDDFEKKLYHRNTIRLGEI